MSSRAGSSATGAPAAGKRKKATAATSVVVKTEPTAHADDDAAAAAAAAAEDASKPNRRLMKKAKVEVASAVAAASEAEAARLAARPAATQKRASKRQRAAASAVAFKENEEKELENFLFGNEENLLKPVEQDEEEAAAAGKPPAAAAQKKKQAAAADNNGEMTFEIDTAGVKEEEDADVKPAAAGAGSKKKGKKAEAAAAAAEADAAPKAAWNDADDASHSSQLVDLSSAPRLRKLKVGAEERFISGSEYSRRLRAVFTELNPGTAAWATLPPDASDQDITTLLLQSAANSSTMGGAGAAGKVPGGAARGEPLPSTTVDLLRLKDANLSDPSASIVSAVRFHPGAQLLLTAGMDKMVRLFQIDGQENAKVQGIWLEDLPIHAADWLPSPSAGGANASKEIIATGRRSHFYSIDIESSAVVRIAGIRGREERSLESMVLSPDGKYIAILANDGYVLLLDGKNKQYVGCMKQNGSVRGASFSPDGSLLFTTGSEGLVYVWDVPTRRVLYKHADHGSIASTSIAIDQADKGYYAVGSDSGVVNMYHTSALSERIAAASASSASGSVSSASARMSALARATPPSPLKSLMNLTTPIDLLRFNHDASLMLMASRRKKDALKLVHVESQTVFANWPTSSTPLHYVTAMDFSPNSGYMALGNDRGRVLLYRLTHYPRA